jgi:hypothetical protein
MTNLWPAIIAVIGTLSGSGLTLWFAYRDKERSFERDWVRKEFENRADVYNDVLAKTQAVIFAVRQLKSAVVAKKKVPSSWQGDLEPLLAAMRDALAAKTLYCSQAMRDIHRSGLRQAVEIDAARSEDMRAYFQAIEDCLSATVNAMLNQAAAEVSLASLKKRLAR